MKRRWLRRLLYLVFCLVIVLLGIVAFAASTQTGLNVLVSQAIRWAPGELQVGSAKGRLIGPFSVEGVSYSSPEIVLGIESFHLQWAPGALWSRQVNIAALHTDGLRFTRKQEASATEEAVEAKPLPDTFQLPVSIELQDLRITDSQFVFTPGAEPVTVDSVTLTASYLRNADLTLNTEVAASLADLQARLRFDPASGNALDGQLEFTLRPDGLAPVVGTTALAGTLDALQIKQQLAAPYGVNATALLHKPLSSLSLEADIQYAIASLSEIREDLPPVGVEGTLDYEGSLASGDSKLKLVLSNLPELLPGNLNADAAVEINEQRITLKSFQTRVAGNPLSVNGQGTVDLASGQPIVDLLLDWKDVSWPLSGEALVSSIDGSAQVSGNPEDYKVLMNTAVQTRELASFQVTTVTQGSLDQANTAFTLQALDGSLAGQLDVTLKPALGFKTLASGSGFNPGALLPDWAGDLAINLDATGQSVNETLSIELETLEVAGELRELPVQLSAKGGTEGKDISIGTLALRSGPTTIELSGKVTEQLDLDWSVNSPDLSTLMPDARGKVNGTGRLRGTAKQPVVSAQLEASDLGYQENSLQSLSLDSRMDTASGGKLDATFKLLDGRLGATILEQIELRASGAMDAHNIVAAATSNQGNVDVEVSGSLKGQSWLYAVTSSQIEYPGLAPWVLKKPAGGVVSADKASIDNACFTSAKAELCFNAVAAAQELSADYKLSALPLSYFKSMVPETTRLLGLLDSDGSFVQTAKSAQPVIKAALNLKAVRVDVADPDNEWVRVATLNPGIVKAELGTAGLAASAKLDLVGQGGLTAAIDVVNNGSPFAEQPLSGRITGEFNDIGFLAKLAPDIEKLQGRFTTDITLAGTPSVPDVSGDVVLNNGELSLQTPGLEINAIKARITGNGNDPLVVSASAKSGEGTLQISGKVQPSVDKPMVDLLIQGSDFTALNTMEAQAAISPDIQLKLEQDELVFDGLLGIPFAAITPIELPADVVQVSSDQVIVGSEAANPEQSRLKLRGKLKIVMGDDVTVDAFGLKARLAGDLTASESPGVATTAKGQLDIVDGTFKAYGQNLKIRTGKVLFAGGPIAEPGFDVEAVRLVTTELEVGVRARGAISQPEFSLFSSPPVSESEQISYLVLGRPLQDNSPSENSAVRQAAMALGVAGGTLLTEKFGDKLGVDEIKIDSELRETGEQASLVVGKYLSPKLFVSYGIGLFEPVSTLRLNYSITDYLKLITETTESKSGGDFVFTFERGR